ncbi:hypothetical protein KDI_45550 [Dictyobacter arantiisoli]|uniref:histidine kinase n=2 Tax=Dictyobacter arantiisoli TaxID=2014874 RepID=A0A5A5THD9_9CHLR|nr:hypothetical protein KDI_45550 [Dictyobacter arantiisoli]
MQSQEHTRLLKALRESELLRELSELLASSLDTTRILQVLVKRATEACDVARCAVWLLDDSRTKFLPSAYHTAVQNLQGKPLQIADRIWRQSSLAFDHPLVQQLFNEKGLLILEDLQLEKKRLPLAEKFLVRSILLVALIREDRLVGLMSLDNPGQLVDFTHDQQQLARAIGQQAAAAIDNARLYQAAQVERQRAERLIERAQSIYQVAMVVNSGEELPHVLDVAALHLASGLQVQQACIAVLDKDHLKLANQSALPLIVSAPPAQLSAFPHCSAAIKQQAPQFVYHDQLSDAEQIWFKHLGMEHVLILPLLVGGSSMVAMNDMNSINGSHSSKKGRYLEKRGIGFAFVNYRRNSRPPSSGYLAFAQDIAAHCALAIEKTYHLAEAQRAEALANERANTLDAVFNAMTEGLIVLDHQGKVVLSNENAAHFMGLTQRSKKQLAAYLQQHPVYTISGQPLAPEHFPLTRALHGERIRGERFLNKNADGVEHAIEVNIEPLLDNDHRKIGIVSAFRDITEQVRVERRIRRALETMLHAAEAVSGVTDMKEILYRVLAMTLTALNSERGVIQIYNETTRSFIPLISIGFTREEVACWLQEQAHWLAPDQDASLRFHERMKEGHATLITEDKHCQESNTVERMLVLATPITHNKRLLGMLMLDRSINYKKYAPPEQEETQPLPMHEFNAWDMAIIEGIAQFAGLAIEQTHWQQEAAIARTNEATMRESNALKDEFLAITAHEFRTPLTIILAHSQMMSRQLGKSSDVPSSLRERMDESIAILEEQTRDLTNIVNTFLEVTHLNRGQIELKQEELDSAELIKESVTKASITSGIHQISYLIEEEERPYLIKGDKARLQQIFTNLLQNAIKYSPEGGPISAELSQSETRKEIRIVIADQGIGVPLEAQQHLFERFYRAPNITNSQARGVGLGLYLVAEFVRLHGGSISVESSGIPGQGSRFILTFPAA